MVFKNHNCGFFIAFHWACAQWFGESPRWGFEEFQAQGADSSGRRVKPFVFLSLLIGLSPNDLMNRPFGALKE